MTMEQPASRAGASFPAIRNCGMFHGTMAATTPVGSLRTMMSSPKAPGRVSSQAKPSARSAKASMSTIGQGRLGELGERDRASPSRR